MWYIIGAIIIFIFLIWFSTIKNPFIKNTTENNQNIVYTVKCPNWVSTQIQITKRGWKSTTGYIGSGNNESVCLRCMKKF